MIYISENKKALIMIIGILDSLYNEAISIEEANKCYFSPKTAIQLEKNNVDSEIVKLVWECCELENIYTLIPHKLKKNIDMLKNRAIDILKSL